jgi:hypothetical protein
MEPKVDPEQNKLIYYDRIKVDCNFNQFSVDVLDCLIGFYQATSDSEEFLVIIDKIFETIAEMQKNMEKSHGEALKKIL